MAQAYVDMDRLKTVRRESLPYELARGRRRSANPSTESSKSRYSLGTIYECYNTRLTNAYRSINKNQLQNFRESLTIPEEIDAGEPPPVDESLFFENLLVSKNTDLNRIKTSLWSLLSAQEMKLMLEIERGDLSTLAKCDETLKNTAYLWACFRNLTQLLPRLESLGADFRYTEPRTGMNAVLVSSLAESRSCLEYLILTKDMSPNVSCKTYNFTPLHFAALANSKPIAELILENGAKLCTLPLDVEPVLHSAIRAGSSDLVQLLLEKGADVTETNQLGESCLHVACSVQSVPLLESLVQVPGIDLNCTNNLERTPLHYAVMSAQGNSSLELVDVLLKNGALINVADQSGLTPLHIAALNELSDCVENLIWAGADLSATTATGHTALSIILKKIPETLQVFRDLLDSCVKLQRPATHNKEFEVRLHFDVLFPSNHLCETSFVNTFVEEHRKDLLSHPLVMAFLYLKWEKIKNFYLARIFIYTLTVIFITTYVLSALAYRCYNRDSPDQTCSGRRFSGLIFQKTAIEIQWYLALVLICILIPQKVLAFLVHRSEQYFRNVENILDIIVFLSVFATSFVYTGKTYDWQNYVGAFGVLCGWTNLMMMVGQLPAFGTYVAMFTHIQFEFAKLLLAYSGMLIGFALSFCVIFVSEPSFGNPFTGLIKVLAMMAGDVDFEGLINQDILDGSYIIYHPLSVCSQILITLFIVFVTVILMNLLVGIAVNDIQSLRNHAGLTKLVRQAKMILFIEMVLCNKNLPRMFRRWASRYNVNIGSRKLILVVKPLNSLEKRLPQDILKVAYEIAQKNPPLGEAYDGTATSRDQLDDLTLTQKVLDGLLTKMKEQEIDIKVLHEQLRTANKLLECLCNKMLV